MYLFSQIKYCNNILKHHAMLLLIMYVKHFFADRRYSYPRHFTSESLLAMFKRNSENKRNLLKFSEQMKWEIDKRVIHSDSTGIHHTLSRHGILYLETSWIYG